MKTMAYFLGMFVFLMVPQQNVLSQGDAAIHTSVDKLPKLKGSGKSFSNYVLKHVDETESYKLRGVEGDLWVSFIVRSTGIVTNVEVEKGIDPELDKKVVEFIGSTGPWKPGMLNRKNVDTQMRVPMRFELSEGERIFANQLKTFNKMDTPPLFVLDNKPVDGIVKLESYNVESVRVIKGEKAMRLYGDRAKNGVVIITSKNGTPPLY